MDEKTLIERIDDAIASYNEGAWVVETNFEKRMVPLLIEAKKKLAKYRRVAWVAKLYLDHGEPDLADDLEKALADLETSNA